MKPFLASLLLTLVLVQVHDVGSSTCTNPPIISHSGILQVHLGAIVSITCTLETEAADCRPVTSLRKDMGNPVIDQVDNVLVNTNNRCTSIFSVNVTESYALLHCGFAGLNEDPNCTSQLLHLLVSPVLEEVQQFQSYVCTIPCIFETMILYTYRSMENRYSTLGSLIEDPDFVNSKMPFLTGCMNGFKTTGINLNISKSCFINVLPNIICGGRNPWNNDIIFSEQIDRSTCGIPTTTVKPTTPTQPPSTTTTCINDTNYTASSDIVNTTCSAIVNTSISSYTIFYIFLLALIII